MELKYLKTFQAIVETGSFARAAGKLNYSQSAITFQIDQLEQEFGAPLFEKVGRRMALTEAGRQLVPYVEKVLLSVEQMNGFRQELAECRGELRIAAGETLLCYRLPAIIKEFHRQAPQARLFIRSMNCYEIRDALLAGEADLGIFYENVGGFGESLTAYPMGTFPMVLAASPEVAAAYPDFITPDRGIPLPLIINEERCIFRQIFEQYLKERAIRLDHTIELWSIPTIKALVRSNAGVTFLPLFAAEEELAAGTLREISTALGDRRLSAVCAHHKNKWVSPLMQLFIDLCKMDKD